MEAKLDFKEILKVYYNSSIQFLYRTSTSYKYTFNTVSHSLFFFFEQISQGKRNNQSFHKLRTTTQVETTYLMIFI